MNHTPRIDFAHIEYYHINELPPHMQESVAGYLLYGWEPGNFLRAVLENDLVGAFRYADVDNWDAMGDWARWLYSHCPITAWGSPDQVDEWIIERRNAQEETPQ